MPARQFEQLDEEADDENVATRQLEHMVADALEYVPAAHVPVTADCPVVAQYDPAGHGAHTDDPVVT